VNAIGNRLRQRREAIGLSQGQVAQYEGISQSYLSDIERGRNEPAVWSLLAQLARRYHTSTDYLLGLTTDPSPPKIAEQPEVLQEVYTVALQLSERRQRESLHILQALLDLDRAEEIALQEELTHVQGMFDQGDEENRRRGVARLLDLLATPLGTDSQALLRQLLTPRGSAS
jgi:transcriptional regulator with XRE-family HTH domain